MGADNPGWVAPGAGAVRALPAALTLTGQARARKRGRDPSNRLADQASGLLGRDAILTITGSQDAGKLPDCGAPVREQVTRLAGAGEAGIGIVILIRDHELPGRVFTGAAAMEAAGAASQIPADCNRKCTTKGSGPV